MNTDKTLEDKIYRVLQREGQNSKEIAKVFKDEIQNLKEKYEARIKITEKQAFRIKTKSNLRYEQLCSELGIYDDIVKDLEELIK